MAPEIAGAFDPVNALLLTLMWGRMEQRIRGLRRKIEAHHA